MLRLKFGIFSLIPHGSFSIASKSISTYQNELKLEL